jgi:hypothetical protein
MLLLERRIAGLFRYRRVFYPRHDQLVRLLKHLGRFDVVRVFSDRTASSSGVRPIAQGQGQTTVVDLSLSQDAVYAGMHSNCRYKIRRADKLRDRIDIVMNTATACSDFFALYNSGARARSKIPHLTPQRLNEYLPHADVFTLYFDGQPTCGRLVLRDVESRTVLMMHSATRRFEEGADTITVGLLNRYLYWHEMKTYQAAGIEKYDFGGAGSANPSATQFKQSFGGHLTIYHYSVYAGRAPIAWELAHALYTRWTGQTFDVGVQVDRPRSPIVSRVLVRLGHWSNSG